MRNAAWISFLGRRWFAARRSAGGAATSWLAGAGIAVGVAALIVVLGVMNGFQQGYIDALLEVASFDARLELDLPGPSPAAVDRLASRIADLPGVKSVLPFMESQVILRGRGGVARPILLRAVPADAARRDPGLFRSLGLVGGSLPERGLVLGNEAARWLGLAEGDDIEILGVSASRAEGIEPRSIRLGLAGGFRSGYYDFDASMAYLGLTEAAALFPGSGEVRITYGIKLEDRYKDPDFARRMRPLLDEWGIPAASLETWRSYNRSFFGALRTEKTAMMLLVGLIFLVVGVNIYHAMRRAVAERSEDLAVLRALGGPAASLKRAFILDGLVVGAGGAFIGLAAGLLIAVNINEAFSLLESAVNALASLPALLGGGAGGDFRVFSPKYFYLMEVPVRLYFPEVLFIVVAATASGALAASAASTPVLSLDPAEALRYE